MNNGYRVLWDGNSLTTKYGVDLHVPDSFKIHFPKLAFEAHLWYCEMRFLIIRRSFTHWNDVKLIAFDCPTMLSAPYEERLKILRDCISDATWTSYPTDISVNNPVLTVAKPRTVEDVEQTGSYLFRKEGSKYLEHDSLFKFEVCFVQFSHPRY